MVGARSPTTVNLPSVLDCLDEIERQATEKSLAIFLDYDGTLTPIVATPDKAILSEQTRDAVGRLAVRCTVGVISGRDLTDVQRLVGLKQIFYAGSHGFDIAGPVGQREDRRGVPFLPALDRAERELRADLMDIDGALIERKRFSLAAHYRLVAKEQVPSIEQAVDRAVNRHQNLRKGYGKKVFELRPKIDWHKGKALLHLLERLGQTGPNVLPIYVGDDSTDEDAFRALQARGIGIVVREGSGPTAARYGLRDPEEVHSFLEALITILDQRRWTLIYEGFVPAKEGLREALCTLANGYIATRGAAPESDANGVHYPGTYLACGYNRLKTEIAGRVIKNEDLVNLPNWLLLKFRIAGGEWFDLGSVEILDYRQQLDMKPGILVRTVNFRDKDGHHTSLTSRRFIHMRQPHLAGLETTLTAKNWSGPVEFHSAIDGRVVNCGVERYRELNNTHLRPLQTEAVGHDTISLKVETTQSGIRIGEAARTQVFLNGKPVKVERYTTEESGYIAQQFSVDVEEGDQVRVEKIVALYTSRDHAISECSLQAQEVAARTGRFSELLESHTDAWRSLWRRFDIEVTEAKPNSIAMILHLHIFHLLQTISPHTIDLDVGVPARGWHGEAYRGHVFWDELFVFPLLNYRIPDITRSLLKYRYRRLNEARAAAKRAGYRGAMYPWQSGSSGREETQKVHLNPQSGRWNPDHSHLQRHINSSIAYNVWRYYETTLDHEFLYYSGAEMILEIARFWASTATYNGKLDRYEILGVMGPDEYHDAYPEADTPGVNNNAYTNVMAVWVLCTALEMLDLLPEDRRQDLCGKLDLRPEELEHWRDVSHKMRVVFHGSGIISQFEGYNQLEEFDWGGYCRKYGNIQRLDRILEAEGDATNRYKASKQADVLMLFYLFSTEELKRLFEVMGYSLEPEMIPKNIEYYVNRTSHGSTLSRVVHSWVLARADRHRAWQFFMEALESDVADIQGGTTAEGIHLGAMAGTVDLMQRGFTGMEQREGVLWFNPCLPADVLRLRMNIRYRGHSLELEVTRDKLKINGDNSINDGIKVGFRKQIYVLERGDRVEFPL